MIKMGLKRNENKMDYNLNMKYIIENVDFYKKNDGVIRDRTGAYK